MESLLLVFDLLEYFFDLFDVPPKFGTSVGFSKIQVDVAFRCLLKKHTQSTQIKVQLKLNQLWY